MFDINSIKMANNFVLQNGVKILVYGAAGSGKTRFATTARRPLLWAIENGCLSIKDDNIPVVSLPIKQEIDRVLSAWDGRNAPREDPFKCINDFVDWVCNPLQSKDYDTLFVDSLSELSSLVFQYYDQINRNGQRAYGELADRMLIWIKKLNYCQKDVVFICKETQRNIGTDENPVYMIEPYFEGQKTKLETLHLIDVILRFKKHTFVNAGKRETYDVAVSKGDGIFVARDRSNKLNEFEYQHFDNMRSKLLGLNNQQNV